jgi:hypothetical protein
VPGCVINKKCGDYGGVLLLLPSLLLPSPLLLPVNR